MSIVSLSLIDLDPLGPRWIHPAFLFHVQFSFCSFSDSGGDWMKIRTDMLRPSGLAGLCGGHLLKCLAMVVSLL